MNKRLNIPVVIMAGGEGKRLLPFTHVLPKPLIPIKDKPIIELIMERFSAFGCRNFYLSINYKANLLKAYFNDLKHSYKISYIQEDVPLGTAGSLSLLKETLKNTFFLTNCDILIEADYAQILRFHQKNKNKITLVASLKHYTIPYGVCEMRNGSLLKSIKEKPEYDFLVNSGMYILEPEVLLDIPRGKFYNMTDLLAYSLRKKEKVRVYPIPEHSLIDMGEWEKLQDVLKGSGSLIK